jgi:hypothetical protein
MERLEAAFDELGSKKLYLRQYPTLYLKLLIAVKKAVPFAIALLMASQKPFTKTGLYIT